MMWIRKDGVRMNHVLILAAVALIVNSVDVPARAQQGGSSGHTHDAGALSSNVIVLDEEDWSPDLLSNSPYLDMLQICFEEGTTAETVEQYHEVIYGPAMPRYFLGSRWLGGQGNPATVTWSFVPDGTSITDGTGGTSNLFAQMDSKFAAQGGRATWINRFQQCFDRWEELSGLTFQRVTSGGNDWDDGVNWPTTTSSPARGQIRICGRSLGAGGTLAYAYFPNVGDILVDMSENWGSSTNQHRFLRNTIMHEVGHAFGVSHVCSSGSSQLMEPFIDTSFDGPRHDDIRAVQRHYGDPFEIDNLAAGASNIGTLGVGSPISLGALPAPPTGTNPVSTGLFSIDADGEQDYFAFTVSESVVASVSVSPRGFTYDNQAQAGNGSCPGCCSNVNSLAMADLNVQIIDSDGSTVLGTGAAQPAGSTETLNDVLLPAAGTYYLRVYEGNSPTQPQLYAFDLSAVAAPCESPSVNAIPDDSSACSIAYASATPSASGGTPPYTWSLGGTPPPGVTIDANTGVVSWPNPEASPTAYNITVQATSDCGGSPGAAAFQLMVKPGDFNGDGLVSDIDIPSFVDHLLGVMNTLPCAADVNLDTFVDGLDVQEFVDSL